jgi:hypothetical protein
MEFSILTLITFGILVIVNTVGIIILYPELQEVIKELNKDSLKHLYSQISLNMKQPITNTGDIRKPNIEISNENLKEAATLLN